jgi:hypothetical protein
VKGSSKAILDSCIELCYRCELLWIVTRVNTIEIGLDFMTKAWG